MTAEDTAARELLAEHGASIRRLASFIARQVPFAVDAHELWPVGYTAAWRASRRYRAGAGATIGGWVRHAARGAMIDEAYWLATGRQKQRDRRSAVTRDGAPRAVRRPGSNARVQRAALEAVPSEAMHDRAPGPELTGVAALVLEHARAILAPRELRALVATACGWPQTEIASALGSRRQATASAVFRSATAKLRAFYDTAA